MKTTEVAIHTSTYTCISTNTVQYMYMYIQGEMYTFMLIFLENTHKNITLFLSFMHKIFLSKQMFCIKQYKQILL